MAPIQPVLISGAGLSGLLLAQGLKQASIPFRMFERDPCIGHRPQGYLIRIHGDGITALRSALPPKLFAMFEKTCAEAHVGAVRRLNPFTSEVDEMPEYGPPGLQMKERLERGERPYTPDRTVLRRVLMTDIEESIEFGKTICNYEETAKGVTVHFTDGTSASGALLVAADGGRSQVRKQYAPEHKPVDTAGRCIYGKTPLTPDLEAKMSERLLRGMFLAKDDSRSYPVALLYETLRFPQRDVVDHLPNDYIYWVIVSRPETHPHMDKPFWKLSGDEAARLSLELTRKWDPEVRAILELQEISRTSSVPVSSIRPDFAMWEPSQRVTLIGDAAHVMSPSGAIGASIAFRDAASLSRILAEDGISKEAIGKYESEMGIYAKEAIMKTFQVGRGVFDQMPFEECKELDL
ncbi:2-polyprenyl-6-methoxyphenol hydroxylase [Saccharata proteae CBS 121410]|uniref:2-polyprenyl-6-methoxyphenol hydroxylase n=1 Tax=Saccharata proteae CBS 121410 TaxID=1314787 RepID=A0A6A5YAW7_9PEZI|nr:2-polyprenyl-6-methoxyphenol hydroxylase [Saccharata proteae CBS 121410]